MGLCIPAYRKPTKAQIEIAKEHNIDILNYFYDPISAGEQVIPGVYHGATPRMTYWVKDDFLTVVPGTNWRRIPEWLSVEDKFKNILTCFPSYGLVDSPEQFVDYYADVVDETDIPVAVFMYWVPPLGHPAGGARWHKQGQYLGDGNPEGEYISEFSHPNGVWSFEVCRVIKKRGERKVAC